jgi:hypothetical protein
MSLSVEWFLRANLMRDTEIPRMHIQNNKNSVTLTPFGSVAQGVGDETHPSRKNMRGVDPADIIPAAFALLLICVLLIAFVF